MAQSIEDLCRPYIDPMASVESCAECRRSGLEMRTGGLGAGNLVGLNNITNGMAMPLALIGGACADAKRQLRQIATAEGALPPELTQCAKESAPRFNRLLACRDANWDMTAWGRNVQRAKDERERSGSPAEIDKGYATPSKPDAIKVGDSNPSFVPGIRGDKVGKEDQAAVQAEMISAIDRALDAKKDASWRKRPGTEAIQRQTQTGEYAEAFSEAFNAKKKECGEKAEEEARKCPFAPYVRGGNLAEAEALFKKSANGSAEKLGDCVFGKAGALSASDLQHAEALMPQIEAQVRANPKLFCAGHSHLLGEIRKGGDARATRDNLIATAGAGSCGVAVLTGYGAGACTLAIAAAAANNFYEAYWLKLGASVQQLYAPARGGFLRADTLNGEGNTRAAFGAVEAALTAPAAIRAGSRMLSRGTAEAEPGASVLKPEAGVRAAGEVTPVENAILRIPSAVEAPERFPKDFLAAVERSPSVRKLRDSYGEGEGLTIEISSLKRETLAEGFIPSSSRGETIQSKFLQDTLRRIFPKARLVPEGEGGVGSIRLNVTDTAEGGYAAVTRPGRLEMKDLKPANPGVQPVEQTEVRRLLGIPEDAKVIALNSRLESSPEILDTLVRSVHAGGADVVIVNQAMNMDRVLTRLKLASDIKVLRLSELDGRPLPKGRYIIVNDTSGRMHAVYGASDGVLVSGPVNMAEPLLARKPTTVFGPNSSFRGDYERGAMHEMTENAVASGARKINFESEVPTAVREMLTSPVVPHTPPYLAPMVGGETAVENFMRQLEKSMLGASARSAQIEQFARNPAFVQNFISNQARVLNALSAETRTTEIAQYLSSATPSLAVLRAATPEQIATLVTPMRKLHATAIRQLDRDLSGSTTVSLLLRTDRLLTQLSEPSRTAVALSPETRTLLIRHLRHPNLNPHTRKIIEEALGFDPHKR